MDSSKAGSNGWASIRNGIGSNTIVLAAQVLVAGLVSYFVFAFFYIALARMGYVFTLEWLEGASLIQVHRLLSGQPLYVQPTFDYVPLIYSPLYFYVSALFARVLGFGFLPLRLVSFLSTLGCVAMVFLVVRQYTANLYASVMAAGSFLALYKISDTWFDLARVDMLAVFLTLLGVYLMQSRSAWRLIFAGVAISLAAITKQTYWILVLPVLVYALFLHGRWGLVMAASVLVVSLGAHLLLNAIYQGWYSFFIYSAGFGQGSSILAGGIVHFMQGYWLDVVFKTVPIFFLLFVLFFVLRFRTYRTVLGLLALSSGMIVLSWLGILNKGGFNNVLIPSYTMFLIGAWLAIGELLRKGAASDLARAGILLVYALQLGLLLYPVAPQIPTARDFKAGQALLQELRRQPGDVYIPFDNYLALNANKKPFAGFGSLGDLNQLPGGIGKRDWNRINAQLRDMLKSQAFSLIILDENADWGSAQHYFETYYQSTPIHYSEGVFFPVAGWRIRPGFRYTPIAPN